MPRKYFKALQFLDKYDPVKGTVHYVKVNILVSLNNCIGYLWLSVETVIDSIWRNSSSLPAVQRVV